MANIEFSGVLGDSDLSLKLSPGPHPTNGSERGIYFWPEVSPGYFRAGEFTIHNNIDYLFAREGRVTYGTVTGSSIPDKEISRLHGPTLAAFFPTTGSSGLINIAKSVAATGWVSRDPRWNELVHAPCRQRLYKLLTDQNSWVLLQTLSDNSKIYSLTVGTEVNGFGTSFTPLLTRLTDDRHDWVFLGTKEDLISCGVAGAREWARGTSGNFIVRCSQSQTPPTGLVGCWIAGQASLDWEELAITTSEGVPLSVGTKHSIGSVELQFPKGGVFVTGATVASFTTFPRMATVTGSLEANQEVVVRYKPTGVYGTSLGSSGVIVACNVPVSSVICIRYEESSPEELFSAGRLIRNSEEVSNALSPLTSSPGFFIGLAPGHSMHSSYSGSGTVYGEALSNSRILAWANPYILYKKTGPSKLKLLVLGGDGIPVPGVSISLTGSSYLTATPATLTTNLAGEAFSEITRSLSATGTPSITATVYNGSTVMDRQTISFVMGNDPSEEDWVKKLLSGKVYIDLLPDKAKSGFSRRRQLAVWRTQADGIPSHFSNLDLNISCKEGRLFSNINENYISNPQGGKELTITPVIGSDTSWWDKPIILEYEPSSTGERDVIRAEWSGGSYPNAYGSLIIGENS